MADRFLVVGAASGIGAATVRRLRARGDAVVIGDIDVAAAEKVAAEPLPGRCEVVACDMRTPDGPGEVVEAAAARLGGLDGVFGNAGMLRSAVLGDWTVQTWDDSIAVNLRAPFLMAQAAAGLGSPPSTLLFTGSTGAIRGNAGIPAYNASKSGLLNLVRSLAVELGPRGVRVNALCPGWVDTPFNDPFWSQFPDRDAARRELDARIPLGHQAEPDDVAGVAAFLLSEDARYITGQAIFVDGGYSAG